MTVRKVGGTPVPRGVVIPTSPRTELSFDAIASKNGERVNVVYVIRSPAAAKFANGTTRETLVGFGVPVNAPRSVSKAVSFTGSIPPGSIVVDGTVTDGDGSGFSLTWIVPAQLGSAISLVAGGAFKDGVAMLVTESMSPVHPAAEAAELVRRLQELLPALDELANLTAPKPKKSARPKRPKPTKQPVGKRPNGGSSR